MAAKPKTVTLVRIKSPREFACEGCLFSTSDRGMSCQKMEDRARNRKNPLYCGSAMQWRIQAPGQRGEG